MLNAPIERFGGRTVHHILGWIAELQHLQQAPVADRAPADISELSAIRELGQRLHAAWAVVARGEDFLWAGVSADTWNAGIEQRITTELHDLRQAAVLLQATAAGVTEVLLLEPAVGPRDVVALAALY